MLKSTFSLCIELLPPSIAKLIEYEGGVEEWLVDEMQVQCDCIVIRLVKVLRT